MTPDFTAVVKGIFTAPLPGADAQYEMAPPHRIKINPAEKIQEAKHGAVAILLFPDPDLKLVLISLPPGTGVHAGQVSFPGGRVEAGEDFADAAIRETVEETGILVRREQLAGSLTPLYIPPSNFYVLPFVALLEARPAWSPDSREVLTLHEVPVQWLLEGGGKREMSLEVRGARLNNIPCYQWNEVIIWGATAMILSEFSVMLRNRLK